MRGSVRRAGPLLLALAGLLAAVAFLGGAASAGPTVSIVAPAEGGTVPLNWTLVDIEVTEFVLDPAAIGQPPQAGHGHSHVFLDNVYLFYTADASILLKDLPAGPHTVRVALYNNDHTPLAPPVDDSVNFTVEGKRPSITVTSPASGAVVWGTEAPLTVEIANFTLNASGVGMPPAPGEGHWHVFVDDQYVNFATSLHFDLTGLTAGDHGVRVALFNNDHTPLAVPVGDSVTVHVAALPVVTVVSPSDGAEVPPGELTLTLQVIDFELDAAAVGHVPQAGHGNFEVRVDGEFQGTGTNLTYTVAGLAVGTHTIAVTLHNNDHTPIPGAAAANVTVVVRDAGGFLPGVGAAGAMLGMAAAFAAAAAGRRSERP